MIHYYKKPVLFLLVITLSLSTVTFGIQSDTAFRTQCSQRLQQSIDLLQKVRCKKKYFFEWWKSGCPCTFAPEYQFQDPTIAQCVHDMEKSNDFQPLIQLAHDFDDNVHSDDELFSREYLVLLFLTYRNLIINNAEHNNRPIRKSIMSTLAEVYTAINFIPPHVILEVIELLTHELPTYLEQHEFYSDMSWKQWLKKHWLALLIFGYVGIVLLNTIVEPLSTIWKNMQRSHHKTRKHHHHHHNHKHRGTDKD